MFRRLIVVFRRLIVVLDGWSSCLDGWSSCLDGWSSCLDGWSSCTDGWSSCTDCWSSYDSWGSGGRPENLESCVWEACSWRSAEQRRILAASHKLNRNHRKYCWCWTAYTVTSFKNLGSLVTSEGVSHAAVYNRIRIGWMKWKEVSGALKDKVFKTIIIVFNVL